MTLTEYDATAAIVARKRRIAAEILREAAEMEDGALHRAGLTHVSRDPGFPCWQIEGMLGYFNSPRDAIAAMEGKA